MNTKAKTVGKGGVKVEWKQKYAPEDTGDQQKILNSRSLLPSLVHKTGTWLLTTFLVDQVYLFAFIYLLISYIKFRKYKCFL